MAYLVRGNPGLHMNYIHKLTGKLKISGLMAIREKNILFLTTWTNLEAKH